MSSELRTLTSFSDPIEAELVLQRLLDEGVPAQLVGELTGNVFGMVGYMAGGMDLLVPECDIERSRTILAALMEEREQRRHDDEPKTQDLAEPDIESDRDQTEAPQSAAEVMTEQAYRASWFGFLLCSPLLPLAHLYSLAFLVAVALNHRKEKEPLPPRFYPSLVIDIVALAIAAVLYGFVFAR